MTGYSKIRAANNSPTSKPGSIESSALIIPSPPRAHGHPKPTSKARPGQFPWQREEEEDVSGGERFGFVLSRTCSSASQRLRDAERGHGGVQAVMRRAFSMRKPSSEVYWRIRDSRDDKDGDEDKVVQEEQQQGRSSRRKRGRIFRACKRLFRF